MSQYEWIHLLEEETPELVLAGWDGPGWYFVDESQANIHGPFETRAEASRAMRAYAESL